MPPTIPPLISPYQNSHSQSNGHSKSNGHSQSNGHSNSKSNSRFHSRSTSMVAADDQDVFQNQGQSPASGKIGELKRPLTARPLSFSGNSSATRRASQEELAHDDAVEKMRVRVNIKHICTAAKVIKELFNRSCDGADVGRMQFSGVPLETILKEIHAKCGLAVSSSQVAVHSFVEYLEHSDKEEFKNLFTDFTANPSTADADDLLELQLLEVHDRDDFNQAAAKWLLECKAIDDFAGYLKTERKQLQPGQIIRYGAPVDRIEEKPREKDKKAEQQEEDKKAEQQEEGKNVEARKSLLALLGNKGTPAELNAILTMKLKDIFSHPDENLKKSIAQWLTSSPNKKFANTNQALSGASRNNVLEKAIQRFLKEVEGGSISYQWVASIIAYRQAVQLMVMTEQQFAKTKLLTEDCALQLLGVIHSFFDGITRFVNNYKKESKLREQMLNGTGLTIAIKGSSFFGFTSPANVYLDNAENDIMKFINGLERVAEIINKLCPEVVYEAEHELARKAAEATVFELIKKSNLAPFDYKKICRLLSDGISEVDALEPSSSVGRESSQSPVSRMSPIEASPTEQNYDDGEGKNIEWPLLPPPTTRQISVATTISLDSSESANNSRLVSPRYQEPEEPEHIPININAQDELGNTFLHYAVQRRDKQKQLVQMVLLNNPDITLANHAGSTAFGVDEKQVILETRNKRYGDLLYRAIGAERGEQVIEIVRQLPDFKEFQHNKESVLQVVGNNNKTLLNLFVSHIPYSVHKHAYKEIYKKILTGFNTSKLVKATIPHELIHAQGESPLLTAMTNCCQEKAKLDKCIKKYVAARLAFADAIHYLHGELFKTSGKEHAILLARLTEIQKAIGEITRGKAAASVIASLKTSPALLRKRQPWHLGRKRQTIDEIEKIDYEAIEAIDSDNDITEQPPRVISDTGLHLSIRRYDLAAVAAWVTDKKVDNRGEKSILAINKDKVSPIELALSQTIDCIEKRKRFLKAIKALAVGFTQIEVYLKGKQASYSEGSSDYKKLTKKLDAVIKAKRRVLDQDEDVHTVLKDLKQNSDIKVKRTCWDFWHRPAETVKIIDRMIKVTTTPQERLNQLIVLLAKERDDYDATSVDHYDLTRKINTLTGARDALARGEPVLDTLNDLLTKQHLITPRHWFSFSEVNVRKALLDVLADARYVQSFDESSALVMG